MIVSRVGGGGLRFEVGIGVAGAGSRRSFWALGHGLLP